MVRNSNEEGDDFYVEFGSEDTKRRLGVKFKIKLPAYKNEKGVLDNYVDKEVIMGIRPEDVYNEEDVIAANPDSIVEAKVEVTELEPVRLSDNPQNAEIEKALDTEATQILKKLKTVDFSRL